MKLLNGNKVKLAVVLLTAVTAISTGCGAKTTEGNKSVAGDNAGQASAQTAGNVETVELTVAGRRPVGDSYGMENLAKAAEKLNQKLEKEDSKYRLKVNPVLKPDDLNQYIIFSSKSGKAPDIAEIGYSNIGWLAEGNYVMQMDDMKNQDVFKNLMPGYWNAVTWDKHIWGVIQDTEARMVFFYKPHLKKLGWTDEQIAALPKKVENGEFTMQDMADVAKQAVDQKLVKHGFLHNTGPRDVAAFYVNNGVQMYDEDKKQYVFDKANVVETFKEVKQLVDSGLLPDSMMTYSEKDRLKEIVNGTALFVGGGIWEEARFKQNGYHNELGNVNSEWIQQNLGVILLPPSKKGGKPITMSNPYVYVASKTTKHPELVKRLLVEVSAPEYQKNHATQSSHIPFTKEAQELAKESAFLNSVSYMTNYSKFVPNHPDEPKYEKIRAEALKNVETGTMTPEKAAEWMEQQMKLDLGSIVVK
ncbi:ABC transporter substrate-binding protein [Paenibacillus hamazuiensis]|uniref:ABC transporter substrate-binding protein n=1 Tax=Paenibacillus hamazuiensis TaxID=2936508 RepID=UPI00200CE4F8|nr:extracellular solute-binding protein [Paenibacillus hamazuiensis]